MKPEDIVAALPVALEQGYRLIDTATIYRNEKAIGDVLRGYLKDKGGAIAREDLFITSKLQPADQGYERAKAAIDVSLSQLGQSYLDCYLIHWPGVNGVSPDSKENAAARAASWRALEDALLEGKLRSIGVSNYLLPHLKEMESYARIMPMINQFELHPHYYPDETVKYCQEKGILVQAYSSLGKGMLLGRAFLDRFPRVEQIASAHAVGVSQVLLKWALQHGFGVVPKSRTKNRIIENSKLFGWELTEEEMSSIDSIHTIDSVKYCWDPKVVL